MPSTRSKGSVSPGAGAAGDPAQLLEEAAAELSSEIAAALSPPPTAVSSIGEDGPKGVHVLVGSRGAPKAPSNFRMAGEESLQSLLVFSIECVRHRPLQLASACDAVSGPLSGGF